MPDEPTWEETPIPTDEAVMVTIGALSRATEIPAATLRTWERRYGYPAPERTPSGHRLYSLSSVPRLKRIAEALHRGFRAGQVVSASEQELAQLLGPAPSATDTAPRFRTDEAVAAVARFDGETLTRLLNGEWARLGPVEFLAGRIAPLVEDIGTRWERGELDIAHEHFFSELLGDLLGSFRLPFDERANGALVVLATLPGDLHGIGIQMASLVLAVAGVRVRNLGVDLPPEEIAKHACSLRTRAVGIGVSAPHAGADSASRLRRLRDSLPTSIELFVGGDGAPADTAGLRVFSDLESLYEWSRRLG